MDEITSFWLQQFGFFKTGTDERQSKLLHYKKDETIYRQGSPLTGVYFIKSGKVKCLLNAGDGVSRIIGIGVKGDFLAYKDAILGNSKNSNTVEALEHATLIFIPHQFFMETLFDFPRISRTFFKLLSRDLLEAENIIGSFLSKSASGRVAHALLWLDSYFKGAPIPISRVEFGNMIGTAPETAIRILSVFKSKRLISLTNRSMKVLNRKNLQKQL